MIFKMSCCWITNKGFTNEERLWFFDNVTVDTNSYPLEIASPGAMVPAKAGTQPLGRIISWNIEMRFKLCLPLEVINKIDQKYISQEIDVSEVYTEYRNCFLAISIEPR